MMARLPCAALVKADAGMAHLLFLPRNGIYDVSDLSFSIEAFVRDGIPARMRSFVYVSVLF
jgi:hypothetical protein